jgi:D-glycero-alpha-D-manno-heptose-7-phosphate kinase
MLKIEKLNELIGKQDEYIAAYGGLQFIQFNPDGSVLADQVVRAPAAYAELNPRQMVFFTGTTRNAADILTRQKAHVEQKRPILRKMWGIAREMRDVLSSPVRESTSCMNERAIRAGALGGKLLGAGGGGFLLFFCEPHLQDQLCAELSDLVYMPLRFELQGSKIIYVGDETPSPDFRVAAGAT